MRPLRDKLQIWLLKLLGPVLLVGSSEALGQPRFIDLGLFQEDMRISCHLFNADFGVSVAGGDVDGDGYDDILAGADTIERYYLGGGGAFLIFGRNPVRRLVDLERPAGRVVFWGNTRQDYTGWVVDLFDFDGDGLDDVWIGAPQFNDAGGNDAHGKIYCLWGRRDWPEEVFLEDEPENGGATLHGQFPWSRFGYALAHGDLDGDGYDDLLTAAAIGRPDRPIGNQITAYVIFGGQPLPTGRIHDLPARKTLIFPPNVYLESLGLSVADLDGDGLADAALRFMTADVDSIRRAGIIYVLWGRPEWPPIIDLARWQDDPHISVLCGTRPAGKLGRRFAVGDFDGQGGSDVAVMMLDLVRRPQRDYVQIYPDLLVGRPKKLSLPDMSRMAAAISDFAVSQLLFGASTTVLDWDGDGFDDLVVSNTFLQRNRERLAREGFVYVLYGGQPLSGVINLRSAKANVRVTTIYGGSRLAAAGRSLAGADINGDGIDDLLIGAWLATTKGGEGSGEVYVLLGGERLRQPAQAEEPRILSAYPNPFNSQTVLTFAVPEAQQVRLTIYNVRGWPVRTLIDAPFPSGRHTAIWNGRDDRGVFAGSGVYFARLFTEKQTAVYKLLYLK